ncbi:MAG: enoyl-CoA hydratase family protein [Nocardioidaceae bacterium]
MPDELVHYTVADHVAHLVLDSPHNKNALSRQLVTELTECLRRAEADDDVRAIVIGAEGNVFCSGADLSEMSAGPEDAPRAMIALFRTIVGNAKPVVASVQGAVRAGGIGIVGSCDIAVVADHATFALTEVRLGLAPAAISLVLLPRMAPRAVSSTFLTGSTFTGAQAVEYGLATAAVPATDLDAEVAAICGELAKGNPQGMRETKRLVNADLLERLAAGTDAMASLSASLFASDAAREAMQAFLKRRKG